VSEPQLPFFSVVIPTYRRPERLADCLQALARLDYPTERFEVIVVDDGGGAAKSCLRSSPDRLEVTLVQAGHEGPAAARNLGAARARGEFVAFTDDDCQPSREWLRTLAKYLAENSGAVVGGRSVNALRSSPYAEASQFILDCAYGYYNANPRRARLLTSNNLAMPAAVFRAIGGFDAGFPTAGGEDRDLCNRLLQADQGMTYAADAVVDHAHALDLRGFWRQHFAYGRGAWRFHRQRARRGSGRLRNELGFYVTTARATASRLRELDLGGAAGLVALLAHWQVANTAGFAWEAVRDATGRNRARSNGRSANATFADLREEELVQPPIFPQLRVERHREHPVLARGHRAPVD
jgi:GT2 family glycosyltransferase